MANGVGRDSSLHYAAAEPPHAASSASASGRPDQILGHRLDALDSLRGVAALVVLVYHVIVGFTPIDFFSGPGAFIRYSPLRIFIAGHAAVVLFFVLSGFVLTLPFLSGKAPGIAAFLVRRVFRIYMPFAVAVLMAWLLARLTNGMTFRGADIFPDNLWRGAPSWADLFYHLGMTGTLDDIRLDKPIWSLVHEMRISLIFPLIAAATIAGPGRAFLLSCGLFLAADVVLPLMGENHTVYTGSYSFAGSLVITLRYAVFFVAGSALAVALWRGHFTFLRLLSVRIGLLVLAVATMSSPGDRPWSDPLMGVGSVAIIAAVVASGRVAVLAWPPVAWLGRISYSLYLLHFVILITAMRLLSPHLTPGWALLGSVIMVFAVADIFNRLVEGPSKRIGHFLTPRRGPRPA